MMEATKIIRLIGGEFHDVSDEDLGDWIKVVRPMVSKKQFGRLYEQALAYLVCHKMKMSGLGESPLEELGNIGIGFAVSSVSEGGSSVSFGVNQGAVIAKDAELGLTSYGVQYLSLRRLAIIPIRCAGEDV